MPSPAAYHAVAGLGYPSSESTVFRQESNPFGSNYTASLHLRSNHSKVIWLHHEDNSTLLETCQYLASAPFPTLLLPLATGPYRYYRRPNYLSRTRRNSSAPISTDGEAWKNLAHPLQSTNCFSVKSILPTGQLVRWA
ncbi:hypothetical protein M404DRAFT_1002994 [Pisolithus tinctorius Marx 270]|uniref:Uncharacterized protein n=1 Tax=Pisolithus tinctorius Marx 270 TaxID=870435 RepID=A0A0C3IXN7_PISTI|nr:hypothetical protein M404DRAFT_1002994 [Pisolithus tinctorius Marx 270]